MRQNGFTLLEILVAMGIFAMVIVGMTAILSFSFRSNKIVWEQLSTQNEGRGALVEFTCELRSACNSSLGAFAIAEAGNQQIIFYSNIDVDSLIERVRYFKDGTTLKKGIIKPSGSPLTYSAASEAVSVVVEDVSNGTSPVFYYYDQSFSGSGTPLVQPVNTTNIRLVKISLDIEEDPQASPTPFHIESKVQIRNLKTN